MVVLTSVSAPLLSTMRVFPRSYWGTQTLIRGGASTSIFQPPHVRNWRIEPFMNAVNNEEAAAKAAAFDTDGPTIFDKIISKEIPSAVVYEDDTALAFRDISPQAPVHVLVIPKFRDGLTHLGKAEERHENILGHLMYVARIVAEKEGILDGFRVVVNSGPSACQSVYHLHLHVLGGRQMKWPPG
uniref:HIT domain-containing protein n=1 Tax=Kalanchoe fedtschenkoi TaxID=63787 RepID=A0A7N0T4K3_KALFE